MDRVRQEKDYLIHTVGQYARRNSALLSASAKRAKNHKSAPNRQKLNDYARNARMLGTLMEEIEKRYSDPASMARRRLGAHVGVLNSVHSDYDSLADDLERLDPDALYSPFRYMLQLPVRTLKLLKVVWRLSRDTNKTTAILAKECPLPDVASRVAGQSDRVGRRVGWDVQALMEEIQILVANRCHAGVAVLGIVLTEGLLWQFARYLNRRSVRIFMTVRKGRRVKYFAYKWNHQLMRYEQNGNDGKPAWGRHAEIHSANFLLSETRLQEYFPLQVYNFLIGEYCDERNTVAHGRLVSDPNAALRALLCLESVLWWIQSYLDLPNSDGDHTPLSVSERLGTI